MHLKVSLILLILSMKNRPNLFAKDFSSTKDGRIVAFDPHNILFSACHSFLPSPQFLLTPLVFIMDVIAPIYLLSEMATIFRGLVSSPSTFILPSHALGSPILVSYPAWCRFNELFGLHWCIDV